jgi:acyl carrier protein
MKDTTELRAEIKKLMVDNLMLQLGADQISDALPLFGPNSLGLDSVDALQLVVALDKTYGLKLADPETARRVLQSVDHIAAAVEKHLRSP